MTRFILLSFFVFNSFPAYTQEPGTTAENLPNFPDSFLRYTDFHIHPTYKHYFRDRTNKQMKEIFGNAHFDKLADSVYKSPYIINKLRKFNWEKSPYIAQGKNKRSQQWGETSDLRNYDQAGYPELKYVPGSILCNSYSPYEKQFALELPQRLISHLLATRMGLRRLNSYSKPDHTPMKDFLAEYYYNLIQKIRDTTSFQLPVNLYKGNGKQYREPFTYISQIQMVRDKKELDSVIDCTNNIFKNGLSKNGPPPLIITPMVMSVEGGQILYDSVSGKKGNIVRPFISGIRKNNKADLNDTVLGKKIYDELLNSVHTLRNLQHRLFFITPAHFAQNHVVGFAKTLDRNPSGIEHRALIFLSETKFINSIIKKDYEGFNLGCAANDNTSKPDSIGFKIIEAFLNPDSSKFGKPTYIDVKHMDITARLQYYAMRRKLEVKFGIKIPIIASHFAVSGEGQALAKATGGLFYPNGERVKTKYFDSHTEIDRPLRYYNERKRYLKNFDNKINKPKPPETTDSNRAMQMQQQFEFNKKTFRGFNETVDENASTGDFNSNDIVIDSNKVGWYYPWSINLFDEEIVEINKSGGIIGLLLDPRQLGAFMPKYRNIRRDSVRAYLKYKQAFTEEAIRPLGLRLADIDSTEYFKTEPLIRNLFYIIKVLKQQEAAEQYYISCGENTDATRKIYPLFVKPLKDDTKKDPWETVAIGGDYDGLIDPIDFAPTVSYIPQLRARMVIYAYIFAQMHKAEFYDPVTGNPFLQSIEESMHRMGQFFYSNGQKFIAEYF